MLACSQTNGLATLSGHGTTKRGQGARMLFYSPRQDVEGVARLEVSIYGCRTDPASQPPVDDAYGIAVDPHPRHDLQL